jgi:hypothetical protein
MIEKLNQQRRDLELLTIEEMLESTNTFLDPSSILISRNVIIGKGNIFYSSTVLQTIEQGRITLGDNNTFTPNVFFYVSGTVMLGSHNLFGDGGVTARVPAGETLRVGNHGRYINGVALTGNNTLGDGSQIIGPIRVQSCLLASGKDFNHPEPDERGAVLKGYGLARNIGLKRGQVIDGLGHFDTANVKMQSFFHPKK